LEGLEMSEVLLSDVLNGVETLRLDSEYFEKKYLSVENYIKKKSCKFIKFSELGLNADASAFYPALEPFYNQGNYPFIRVGDVKQYVDFDGCVKIPFKILHDYPTLKHCKKGDIILTKGGTIGLAGLIMHNCCVTRDLILINSSILKEDDHITLYLYLSSKFAYSQLIRSSSQSVQPHLTITLVKDIFIFNYSSQFKINVTRLYKKSIELYEQSKVLYRQAEELLLETIRPKDFHPSQKGTNIKNFKESFLASGRLDAEYYQPRYEDYSRLIRSYPNGFELLQNVCNLKDDNFIPQENEEYKYIELSDIGNSGDITGCTIAQGVELPTRARRMVKTKDVIISSIEGSLSSCALITDGYDKALCSTGFYVINSKKINSQTLLVLFKSEPMQNILKQHCSGTILTAINKSEFQNIPVPLIKNEIQRRIAVLIKKSFSLRQESEQLLNEAKEMVERKIGKV
jgi:restriction endonuclease S subunit